MYPIKFAQFTKTWLYITLGAVVLSALLFCVVPAQPLAAADDGTGTGPGGVGSTDGSSNLRLWLKASTGVYEDASCSVLAGDGDVVACWADQSGYDADAKAATDREATYYDAEAIRFDGTSATLSTTPNIQLFSAADSGIAAFVVFQTQDKESNAYLLNHGASSDTGEADNRNFELGYGIGNIDGNFGLHRGSDHATLAPSETITNDTYVIMSTQVLTTGTYPTDSIRIFKNGVSLTLDISGAGWLTAGNYATADVPLDIGARRDGNAGDYPDTVNGFHNGDIVEIILYTAPLNTAQRVIIENYLSAKYDIDLEPGEIYESGTTFIQDLAGIGQEADGQHTEAHSAGLILIDSGLLQDNGDYLLASHRTEEITLTTTRLPMDGFESRWNRVWQLAKQDSSSNGGAATLIFDFGESGLGLQPEGLYTLLYEGSANPGEYDALKTSSYITQDQVIFSATLDLNNYEYYTLGKLNDPQYDLEDTLQPGWSGTDFYSITTTGTPITFTAQHEITGPIPLNFVFNFYGEEYTELYASADGFFTFLAGQSDTNRIIPSTSEPNGLLAAWWKDLRPDSSGSVHYKTIGSSPNRIFILQFTNVPRKDSGDDPSTFQIKLFETSNIIEMHYDHAMSGGNVGIESSNGELGIPYYAGTQALKDLSVRYTPRPLTAQKSVNDATPRVGERITYTLVVHSNLTETTDSTLISDTLDPGLTWIADDVAVDPTQAMSTTHLGQTLIITGFEIEAGQEVTFTLPVTVSVAVTPGLTLRNTAVITHETLSKSLENIVDIIADNCWANLNGTEYDTIQEPVDEASENDLIKIAGYCIDVPTREGMAQSVYLSQTLILQGGYPVVAGGTPNWSTLNPTANATTLDAQGRGRVIYVPEGISTTIAGLHITGGDGTTGVTTTNGGGLYVYSATVTLSETHLYSNTATDGGGLCADYGKISILESQVFSNTATDGAGIYLNSAPSILLTDTLIISNTATGNGGGITLDNIHHLTSTNLILQNNTADDGGGIYLSQSAPTLTQISILSNTASSSGGGLYLSLSDARLDNITVTHNTANTNGGGGYQANSSNSSILTGTLITHNIAEHGGGWYLEHSDTTMSHNTVSDNETTTGYGGGFYIDGGSPNIEENTLTDNHADEKGGAIYMASSLAVLSHNTIQANQTSGASSGRGGGGIYITGGTAGSSPTLNNNRIISNTAGEGNAGGIYLSDTYAELNNNDIFSNTAKFGGGGVSVEDGGAPTLNGDNLKFNISLNETEKRGGGGLYAKAGSATLKNLTVSANRSLAQGGGLSFIGGTNHILINNTIMSNTAILVGSSGDGGGIYLGGGATATLIQNYLEDNLASVDGGGLYIAASSTLSENIIISNTAASEGGGVYFKTEGILIRNQIAANHANEGGGLYLYTSAPTLEGNTVHHNTADTSGGGIYVINSTAQLQSTLISENTAGTYGNGLYVTGAQPQLSHTTLVRNDGGNSGVYIADSSIVTLTNTVLVSHTTGLYVTSGTTATLNTLLRFDNDSDWSGSGTLIQEGRDIQQDPLFVDPAASDYHIDINSPALNKGVNTSDTGDIDGDRRPLGGGYDLGADEYSGTCFARLNDTAYYYATVQQAVEASADGDVVKVAGTCGGVQSSGSTSQTVAINNGKSLTIRGGYTLSQWSLSEPPLNPTLLDAKGLGRVISVTQGASVTLEALRITGGSATQGAGIYAQDATLTLSKLFVFENTATDGAGLYLEGGEGTIINTMFVENQATQHGGGVYVHGSSPTFLHTTFARNDRGGVYVTDGTVTSQVALTNTILVSHSVGITVTSGNSAALNYTLWGSGDWSNGSNTDGTGITENNSITGDPGFLAPDALNYHIAAGSAAKEAGVNAGVLVDFDGDERPFGDTYDIGADEFAAAYRVKKSASVNPAVGGEDLVYTLRVTNTGAIDLEGVVRDTLPAPLSPTGELDWDINIAASGGMWTKQVTVTVDADYTGLLTNTVKVTTTLGVTHYYTKVTNVIAKADLGITKTTSALDIISGQNVTYTLSYTNTGPSTAMGVIISDRVPSALSNVQYSRSGAMVTPTGSVDYVWEVAPLAPGTGGMITVTGTAGAYTDGFTFTNTASITSTALDPNTGNNTSAPVEITIGDQAPVATDDTLTTDEDTAKSIDPRSNDDDPDEDPLTVTAVTHPDHGSATTNGTTVTYTPTADYNGSDTFTYTVGDGRNKYDTGVIYVTVKAVNDAPEAFDDYPTVIKATPTEIDVRINDDDIDNSPSELTVTAVSLPENGTASTNGATVTYTPTGTYTGTDSFTYTLEDTGGLTDTATVHVIVRDPNRGPVATDDITYTLVNTPVTIWVLGNDSDPDTDPLSIVDVGTAAHGTAAQSGDAILYTPDTDFTGEDAFDYTISDGNLTDSARVTVTVSATPNDPPQAVDDAETLLEDSSAEIPVVNNDLDDGVHLYVSHITAPLHGTVENLGQRIAYTPTQDFNGNDVFTYTVSDGQYTAKARVNITVTAVNDAPSFTSGGDVVVVEDAGAQTEAGWATGISAGPSDESGQTLTFVLTAASPDLFSVHPTIDIPSGDLSFTPAPDANGSVNIQASLRDNGGTANGGVAAITRTFTLQITPVNDAPTFTSQPVEQAAVDKAYTYAIVATDADDGDELDITAPVLPSWLRLSGSGDNATLSGTPSLSEVGTHPVTLEVQDTTGLTDTQSFSIVVSVAPTVLAVQPTDGEQNVEVSTPVRITFSEAINSGTFDYHITPDPGGWATSWNGEGTEVTLTHADFQLETTHVFTITAADDLDGVALTTLPYPWSFTTQAKGANIYLPLVMRN